MFERFTDRARRVVVQAQNEARRLKHSFVGTEHLLLGLVHEPDGLAAQVLTAMDVDLDGLRRSVEQKAPEGGGSPSGHVPFTPRAKAALEMSLREALELGDGSIGTEHILLGLLRGGGGVAAEVLAEAGVEAPAVRAAVMGQRGRATVRPPAPPAPPAATGPVCPWCRTALDGHLGSKEMAAAGAEPARRVRVFYCESCQVTLGVVSGE